MILDSVRETRPQSTKEEQKISFARALLKSLDSCFNYVLDGLPRNEVSSFSRRGIQVGTKETCGDHAIEDELIDLVAAKDNLFQFSKDSKSTNRVRRESFSIMDEAIHCKQESNWDCGVTCILMVLRFLTSLQVKCQTTKEWNILGDKPLERLQKQWMCEIIRTKSIWTIDLIMLLYKILYFPPPRLKFPKFQTSCGAIAIRFMYCSSHFGVDESYKCFKYYKDAYCEDEKRVEKLFREATKNEIEMIRISHMEINFVVDLVSNDNCVAIALLDYSILAKFSSSDKQTNVVVDETTMNDLEFSGHYVLLYGISRNPKDILKAQQSGETESAFCFIILDPGSNEPFTYVTVEIFERAWKARGTDNDIVFITVDPNQCGIQKTTQIKI